MHFGLLGPLLVVDDEGRPLELGGNQSRMVLAVLLAAAGRVVPAESLVSIVWGDDPPASAAGTLQSYVSRLRRQLEPVRGRGEEARLLQWEPPGYRLAADAGDVDFRRFEELADLGRTLLAQGQAAEARHVLLEADALWRGPALLEYRDSEFALGLVARLEERRLAAAEDRLAAELAVGHHAAAVGELTELVNAHGLREGFRGLLAVALYRSGRQSEALRALADARETLREELGVDPGRPLRDLESAILAQDPSLDLTAAPEAVAAAAPPPVTAEPSRPDGLLGREAELDQLLAALDEATASLRVAIVEGEPGIGKTWLAEAVGTEAARRGDLVLWGRTFEGGAAPALWPLLGPLRALVAAFPAPAEVAPQLVDLLSASGPAEPGPSAAAPARFALMDAVADLLSRAAAIQPVVLVLDDLQWADVESLELLTSVVGRLADAPVLIVVTVRVLEVGRNDPVVAALAAMTRSRGARRLQLRGLASEAAFELITQTSGGNVDPEVARSIHERAEGNPFFTTELARLLASGQELPAADVPSGVRDVVRQRLALLPVATTELLTVAAVVGREVDLGLLAAAAGRDLDSCLDDLEPAVLHRLLVVVAEQPGVYRFAHALVREVVVSDISSLRRARLHVRVADALDDVDDNAEIIAEHLWQAVPVGVTVRAAAALERAARVAVRRLAYTTAQTLLERAVQLRRSAGSDRASLEAELQAVGFLVSVIGAHRGFAALIDSPLITRGKQLAEELGAGDLVSLLYAEWSGLDVACQFERCDPIAEQLLALIGTTDDPMAPVLGHTAYGISRWHHGDIRASAEHLDAAREAADAIHSEAVSTVLFDLEQLRLSLPFSTGLHDLVGDLEDPEKRYDEIVRRFPGDHYWELVVSNFAACNALSVGDLGRAERAARRGLAVVPEGMFAFWTIADRCFLGVSVALQGRLDEGVPLFDEAWAAYTAMGLRTNGVNLLAGKAQALAEAGRVKEAGAALSDAQRELATYRERHGEPLLLLAEAVLGHARSDDPSEVARAFSTAADLATTQGSHAVARRVRATAGRLGLPI